MSNVRGNMEVYGVDWSQRFGAQCPVCGVYTKGSYKHTPWFEGGVKVRYHVCPNPECGHRFQSVTYDPPSDGIEPDPTQLRFLRDYAPQANSAVPL